MKFASVCALFFVAASSVDGFSTPQVNTCSRIKETQLYASLPEVSPFKQGPRIIREELPVVFVYDHCPFCVRVRLALGVKNIKHNVHFLANDDIPTPTNLIGKKIAPIFVSFSLFKKTFFSRMIKKDGRISDGVIKNSCRNVILIHPIFF